MLKILHLITLLVWNGVIGTAQNLIPNPSFEDYTDCPIGISDGVLECIPWESGNLATPDYYNVCAVGTDVWIPDNWVGSQDAHTGDGYVGCIWKWNYPDWQEYVRVQLTEPCQAGYSYEISFYISLSDFYCGIANIGAYFSIEAPPLEMSGPLIDYSPQFESDLGFVSENDDWVLITGCFAAGGGEEWVTIGNFYHSDDTPLDPDCSISSESYYYIDDVSLVQSDPIDILDLDLGDDVTTCDQYEIDPGLSGYEFHWSDGSNEPTLIVTESGIYALTITIGCEAVGVDSIEVTINGAVEDVEIGPPEVTICEGSSYTISLDPELGEYVWQDGSTDHEYSITIAGNYSVTMDDGCDLSTDQISVSVISAPEPFSLGPDTILCEGDEIAYSYDVDLGDFLWQDGSTSSIYIIDEAGVYALTISNQCGLVSDEIEIVQMVAPDIDLGSDQQTICTGESIEYEFDPVLAEYVWQDGSTSSSYTIFDEGIYSVTASNVCATISDEITVFVMNIPELFTLGEDTLLCSGDEIVISFNPELGDFEWQDGSNSPSYTVLSGGNYSLTISNQCGEVFDAVEITEISIPEIDLGANQIFVCEGQVYHIDLDPDIGEYLWQDGSTSSSYTIALPDYYSVTVTNACGTSTDAVEAVFTGAPDFDLGPNLVLCPSQLPVTLNIEDSTNTFTYIWHDGSMDSQYQVIEDGTYSVTVSNDCFAVSDQISVLVQDGSPMVTLPPDTILCYGDDLLLETGAFGEYLWQDSSTNSSFFVTTPGLYAVTITNECGSGSDSISVMYNDSIGTLDLGPDRSLCPGETLVLSPGIPGVSYMWQDSSTADSIIVANPGIYSVHVSSECSDLSDTVVITVSDNPPIVDLPGVIQLCDADTIEVQANATGVQYLWNDGSGLSTLSIYEQGTYSVTVSNACGADSDTLVVLNAGPPPYVNLNDSLEICPGETILITPVLLNAESWLWHDGSSDSAYAITSAGIITVEASNQCGTAVDTMYVSILQAVPILLLGNDTAICPGEIVVFSVDVPGADIVWHDGSTSENYTANGGGYVHATISNQCGTSTDTVEITVLPEAPVLELGITQSLCPGESFEISPGLTDVTYLWHDGSTSPSFFVNTPGLITLTVSNSCGSDIDSLEVIEDLDGPDINLGEDVTACIGDSVVLSAGISGVSYLWQDGSISPELTTTASGNFILHVSNSCGTDSDTVYVEFSGLVPTPDLGLDTTICEGSALLLQSLADDETMIEWQDGSQLPIFTVFAAGTYILFESNRCGMASDTILVSLQQPPATFDLGPDTIICPNEYIVLTAPSTPDFVTWQDGSHESSYTADEEQLYTLQISNQCGLSADSISIMIDTEVPIIDIDEHISWCDDEILTLDASQDFEASYLWDNGSTASSIQINTPGLYTVSVETSCASVNHEVLVVHGAGCDVGIYIPSIFSPNDDGINDELNVHLSGSVDVVTLTFSIFDRWGACVFQSHDIGEGWDGQFRGNNSMPGVYVYVVRLDYMAGDRLMHEVVGGDVTLVR